MRVSDLAMAEFGLRVLVPAGDVDGEVRWVYTTDLADPSPYLSGRELVLTSEGWYRVDADCERFVRALVSSNAAALVAGDVVHGQVPPALVEACRTHDLPLFFAPSAVAYGALSERIERRLLDERGDAVIEALARQRRLVSLLVGGGGVDALLGVLARQTGTACWAQSVSGRPLGRAAGTDLPDADQRAELSRAGLQAMRLPAVLAGPRTVLAIGPRSGRLGFLVTDTDLPAGGGAGTALADTVAELLALGTAQLDEQSRRRQAAGRDALAALDAARTARTRAAALSSLGVDARRPAVLLSVTTRGAVQPGDLAADLAAALADDVLLVTGSEDELVGVVPATGPDDSSPVRRLSSLIDMLVPHLRGGTVRIGSALSEGGVAPFVQALAEARQARELAETSRSGPIALVESARMDSHLVLLAATPDDVRRAYRRRVLGALDDRRPGSGPDLVHTLTVFLDQNGSWQRAAADLHVHVSTLHHRIGRIERLLDRDLATARDRVDCYLALRCPT